MDGPRVPEDEVARSCTDLVPGASLLVDEPVEHLGRVVVRVDVGPAVSGLLVGELLEDLVVKLEKAVR